MEKCVTEFHRVKDKYHAYCKECRKKESAERSEYKKRWYQENKETCIERATNRYQENKEEISQYKVEYYIKNSIDIKIRSSNNYRNNREAILEKMKLAALDPKRKAKRRKYVLEYYHKNKHRNRHIKMWRNLLQNCLKTLGRKKDNRTKNMLGYSSDDLKQHLELLWLPEMTWDNYGEWHIDHIKPVVSFPVDADTKIVNALSNLRPLWATTRTINGITYEGNLNKGRKLNA